MVHKKGNPSTFGGHFGILPVGNFISWCTYLHNIDAFIKSGEKIWKNKSPMHICINVTDFHFVHGYGLISSFYHQIITNIRDISEYSSFHGKSVCINMRQCVRDTFDTLVLHLLPVDALSMNV